MRLLIIIFILSISTSGFAQKKPKDKYLDKKIFWTTMTLKDKKKKTRDTVGERGALGGSLRQRKPRRSHFW